MFKLTVLLSVLVGVVLGDPAFRALVPMLDGRIVGGNAADISDYPYIISLHRSNSHICGGAIISNTWVITAAHCVSGVTVSAFSVRAGSTIRNSGGQLVPAAQITVNPSYSSSTIDYDLALIRLSSEITIDNAEPIPIAPAGNGPVAGSIATITGWGALTEGGGSPLNLQVVEVPIVSQADCRSAYSVSSVTDRMFCAGIIGVGGKDACQGDSGGPVVVAGQLAGVVSWGNGCARPNYPGVKASVIAQRSWVTSVSGV